MAEAGTLHDAFIDELRDTYDAEKQLTKALPKLAKASSNPKLRQAFESHLQETQGQIARLEQVFESLDEKVRGKHCDGIAGIIEEGKSIMEEDFDETTMDACLIAAGQRAEHYEMAAYGTLVAWAQAMGHTEAAKLLQQTLDEEKAADKKLSGLAEGGINQGAADAAHPEEDEEPVAAAQRCQEELRRRPVAGSAACGRGRHGADSAAVADERRGTLLTAWRRSPRRGGSWRTDSTASRRICDPPRRDRGPRPMATRNRTTSSWWKS